MKCFRLLIVVIAAIIGSGFSLSAYAKVAVVADSSQAMTSPVGYWQTIDDKTNQPKSIVKLFVLQGKLYGRIMQVNYQPGHGPADVCDKCTGVRQNQLILGMVFMWGLVPDPSEANHWIDGQVVDPKVGSQYNSELSLVDNGQTIKMLGYMGSTLFGRTQTWHRVPATALQAFPATMVASGADLAAVTAVSQ